MILGFSKPMLPHIACEGSFPYICHGYLGRDLLTLEGFPQTWAGV